MKKSIEKDLNQDNLNNNSLTEIREPSNLFTFSPKEGFENDKNGVCDFHSNQNDYNLESKALEHGIGFENKAIERQKNGFKISNEDIKAKGSLDKINSLEVISLYLLANNITEIINFYCKNKLKTTIGKIQ